MKKLILLIFTSLLVSGIKAQTVNQDTVAKYSKKEAQMKVFSLIGKDIHLDKTQQEKFNLLSGTYADKAIAVLKVKHSGKLDILKDLRKVGEEYWDKLQIFVTPVQLKLMKGEREKYHFGKRFLVKN